MKHTILRNFCVTLPCSSFSYIFELSHFCRTILQNYNWYFFSSTKINKGSRSIISDGWKTNALAAAGRVISGGFPALFPGAAPIEISPE